jgi:hypothetical protein
VEIRSRQLKENKQIQLSTEKCQTLIYKTENRKLKIEQAEPHKNIFIFEAGKTNDIKSLSYQECVLDNKRADMVLCYTPTTVRGMKSGLG